jgi:hypothetical protein
MNRTICPWLALAALMVPTALCAQEDPAQNQPRSKQQQARSPERLAHALAAAVAPMPPMTSIGPQPNLVNPNAYPHILQVSSAGQFRTIAAALASVQDASARNRYAVLVAAGTYPETHVQMRPYVRRVRRRRLERPRRLSERHNPGRPQEGAGRVGSRQRPAGWVRHHRRRVRWPRRGHPLRRRLADD